MPLRILIAALVGGLLACGGSPTESEDFEPEPTSFLSGEYEVVGVDGDDPRGAFPEIASWLCEMDDHPEGSQTVHFGFGEFEADSGGTFQGQMGWGVRWRDGDGTVVSGTDTRSDLMGEWSVRDDSVRFTGNRPADAAAIESATGDGLVTSMSIPFSVTQNRERCGNFESDTTVRAEAMWQR